MTDAAAGERSGGGTVNGDQPQRRGRIAARWGTKRSRAVAPPWTPRCSQPNGYGMPLRVQGGSSRGGGRKPERRAATSAAPLEIGRRRGAVLGLVWLLGAACSRPAPSAGSIAADSAGATLSASASASGRAAPSSRTPVAEGPPPATVDREEPAETTPATGALARWVVDGAVAVGPAGPAAASAYGIVFTTRDGDAVVARLPAAQPRGKAPTMTAIAALDLTSEAVFRRAPPPAVAGAMAYFVHGGTLRRVALPAGGASASIAGDARDGGRVAAARVGHGPRPSRAAVAFLSETPTRMVARLWLEGVADVLTLSPEGAAASAIALDSRGNELLAVTLEARTGMSTVHARRVALDGDAPRPSDDVVVWVGGGAQSFTELGVLAGPGDESWAFTALERDATRFGLARIRIAARPRAGADVYWRGFPNGLDPAPLAVGRVCGTAVVIYARPAAPEPRAPQDLCLAEVSPAGLGPAKVVAAAPSFANVTLAPLPRGALLAYVAEGKTWGETIRCPQG